MPYIYEYDGEFDLKDSQVNTQLKNGHWVTARLLGYNSLRHTIKCLWLVATGKADIVTWSKEQHL